MFTVLLLSWTGLCKYFYKVCQFGGTVMCMCFHNFFSYILIFSCLVQPEYLCISIRYSLFKRRPSLESHSSRLSNTTCNPSPKPRPPSMHMKEKTIKKLKKTKKQIRGILSPMDQTHLWFRLFCAFRLHFLTTFLVLAKCFYWWQNSSSFLCLV